MEYVKLLGLLFFINSLAILDLIVYYKIRESKVSKPVDLQGTELKEEYEEVVVDEFDDRIIALKRELAEKKTSINLENETEVITDEYEQRLYSSVD